MSSDDVVKHEDLGVRMVRLHVDHLDNEDGRVWGVDCGAVREKGIRRRYIRATDVVTRDVNTATVFRPGRRQPRAWLTVYGRVRVSTHRGGAVLVSIGLR